MNEWLVPVCVALIGSSGLFALIQALFQRHWKKQDDTIDLKQMNEKLDNLVQTQDVLIRATKVSLAHDINYLGECCIYAKEITLDNKKTLTEMHKAYRALPGENGLCTVMDEVNRLPVVDKHSPVNIPSKPVKNTTPKKKTTGGDKK